ncbi:hypothetical protein C5167_013310 [Papaver somniferum]|uniref:Staygreen protein domain-containing protein n=1 Tax=Papaver somniferum TaxID=3469 RepID=A0A4Y7IZY3_PAPSO|nr:protein STAY-GREEN LIKE, chloroplastic-like [Papaver somniferum]RZC54454.1 hypothetical protein C5167_013310 [Papaver somniferum]
MACSSYSPSSSSSSSTFISFTKRLVKNNNIKTVKFISSSLTERSPTNYSTSYNPLVFQAARLLGPPARFEASKLKVVLVGDQEVVFMENNNSYKQMSSLTNDYPRTYTLTHCDLTANLTLTISNAITLDQLKGWYNNDDVVAEWKRVKEGMCLIVHCHVSGPNVLMDVAAEFRYLIFKKEMPLVIQAIQYGDSMFIEQHPELMDALVWVYFHSSSKKYNRVECWGALKNAAQGKQESQLQSSISSGNNSKEGEGRHHFLGKWGSSKAIFQALFTFLL